MKQFFLGILLFVILTTSCTKKYTNVTPTEEYSIIAQAQAFFNLTYTNQDIGNIEPYNNVPELNPRFSSARTIDWKNTKVFLQNGTQYVLVPVKYKNELPVASNFSGGCSYDLSDLTKLCIYRDLKGNFQVRQLTFFPDSTYSQNNFKGIVFMETWEGHLISKFRFQKGHPVQKELFEEDSIIQKATVETNASSAINVISVTQLCPTIYGYNYSPADPGVIYYWSEPAGCSYSFDTETPYGQGLTGPIIGSVIGTLGWNGFSPTSTILVNGGNNLIGNILDYNKCFTNIAGNDHIYTVTICIDQPVPSSRQPWGVSKVGPTGSSGGVNPVDVGHAFLIFNEVTGTNIITRNIGFYPVGVVSPFSPNNSGSLNNDDQHDFNISVTITLTNSEFFNMLNYIALNSNDPYNLNTFNCASFVLQTLSAGSVNIISTKGQWAGGSGYDPGDLGEDLRAMNLAPNMTRNANYFNHPNTGNCN